MPGKKKVTYVTKDNILNTIDFLFTMTVHDSALCVISFIHVVLQFFKVDRG